jgi:hypothetical protein
MEPTENPTPSFGDDEPQMELAENPAPTYGDDEWAPYTIYRRYLGYCSASTDWRWERQFPDYPKTIRINGRKFKQIGQCKRWMKLRAAA